MQIFLSFLLSNLSLFLHFPKIFAFLNFFRTFGTLQQATFPQKNYSSRYYFLVP